MDELLSTRLSAQRKGSSSDSGQGYGWDEIDITGKVRDMNSRQPFFSTKRFLAGKDGDRNRTSPCIHRIIPKLGILLC